MASLEPVSIAEEPLFIPEETVPIPEAPPSPKELPTSIPEQQNEEEQEKEPEIDPADLMEIGKHGLPLCPNHKIDASNFCLMDNCPFALNCVLCVKEHEKLHRVPEMNYALGLTLNENLADQLFDKKMFEENLFKEKIKALVLDLKLDFSRKCDDLQTLLVERMETESHEFMLKKIRRFLDKSRDEYNEKNDRFSLLKELCSTFNDFLLLKKSDQVPTVDDEISLYSSLVDQFKKTISLSFKYLNNKVCRIQNEARPAQEAQKIPLGKPVSIPQKQSFSEEMKTTVKMPPTQIQVPRHVTVQSVSLPASEEVIRGNTVQTTPSLYGRESPKNQRVQDPGKIKLYKKNQFHIESVEETNINVRGISPGPRRIKKTRVSYTPGGRSPAPHRRKSISKTIQSEHQRDYNDFDFEPEELRTPRTYEAQRPKLLKC